MYAITNNYNYTPEDLILLSDDQWGEIGMESYVKDIVLRVTNKFIDDKIDITNVSKDTITDLKNIKGIGEWTVSTLFIEYGLDKNLFPLNDKHVTRQMKKLFGVDLVNIRQYVDKWDSYKSVAFWYLWKYDLKKN